jgi:hypothetical protein
MGDVVERSDALDERIAGSADIEALVRYGHTSRRMIRVLGVSLALDILLSVAVAWVAWRADQTSREATSIQAQQRSACLAGNEARAGQRTLWHHVLDLPPTAPRTEAQQQQADQVGAYVDGLFAPRRC